MKLIKCKPPTQKQTLKLIIILSVKKTAEPSHEHAHTHGSHGGEKCIRVHQVMTRCGPAAVRCRKLVPHVTNNWVDAHATKAREMPTDMAHTTLLMQIP